MSWVSENDPLVSIVVWQGPISQLAARLGIEPRRIKSAASRRHGRLELDVSSPISLHALKRQLTAPKPD